MSKVKKIIMKLMDSFNLNSSKIVSNERLAPHFQFLTIKGNSLKNSQWIPGQKIQIKIKNDQMRSYTPSSWNSSEGVLQTLIYMHGNGPGALWARDAKPSDKIIIKGPKKSFELNDELVNIAFFGDETTIGLSYALKNSNYYKKITFFFEVNDVDESMLVLKHLGLDNSYVLATGHLEKLIEELLSLYKKDPTMQFILAGKQQSIVTIREKLQNAEVPCDNITKKVYWGWKDDPNGKLKF